MPAESANRYMFCLKCGYILNGLTEHNCPECGQLFDPRNPQSYSPFLRTTFGKINHVIVMTWLFIAASLDGVVALIASMVAVASIADGDFAILFISAICATLCWLMFAGCIRTLNNRLASPTAMTLVTTLL